MECPFELPAVKKPDFDFDKTGLYRVESANSLFLSFSLKEDEVDYIVQAINSYEKFKTLVQHLVDSATKYPEDYATKDLNKLIPYLIKEAIETLKEKP